MEGHQLTDASQALAFMLAGKATLTIKSLKSGEHITYTVQKPKKVKPNSPTHFVKVRTGNDFAYLGFIAEGRFHHGKKADLPFESTQSRAFAWMIEKLRRRQISDALQIWHEGRCGRCGRALTHPESIQSGIGPECATKMECV